MFKRGFTLIELLTVIAIIGILTAVVMVSTGAARQQARDVKRKADISAVSAALEIYYAQKRSYPTSNGVWVWSQLQLTLADYISSWPKDPIKTGDGTFGQGYVYYSDGSKYIIDATLESTKEEPTETVNDGSAIGPSVLYFSGTYMQGTGSDGTLHARVSSK